MYEATFTHSKLLCYFFLLFFHSHVFSFSSSDSLLISLATFQPIYSMSYCFILGVSMLLVCPCYIVGLGLALVDSM